MPSSQRNAFELAVKAIGRRERTRAELGAWLAEHGVDPEQAEEALERLTLVGQLDDERFANEFAADKRELAGWGPERIRETLARRGVAREIAEAAADEDRSRQLERARALLRERGAAVVTDRERSRALGFLTRRGFEYETAYEAVRVDGSGGALPLDT